MAVIRELAEHGWPQLLGRLSAFVFSALIARPSLGPAYVPARVMMEPRSAGAAPAAPAG